MKKYIFEYTDVIEANSKDEALDKFEEMIVEQLNDSTPMDNVTDLFNCRSMA